MYIVTRSINEYNQEGEYFVAWFSYKPVPTEAGAKHWGRKGSEYEWFDLVELKEGEIYE